MTETVERNNRIARNADRVGLGAMILASICLVALGAHWVSGPIVSVIVLLLVAVLVGVLVLAFTADKCAQHPRIFLCLKMASLPQKVT